MKKITHGTKYMVIQNKTTKRIENIRSNYTYSDKKSAIKDIKKQWLSSDYKVLNITLCP